MEHSRYESRGVSSDKKEVHQAIRHLDQGLFKNTFCKILPDPFSGNPDDTIILHADTAGTKTILAYLYWKETGDASIWKGIAQDALVMNIDDMACSGAVGPYVISNTILRNKKLIPSEILEAIIQGTVEFVSRMKEYNIIMHHAGGETADVGDVVRTADVGFTVYTQLKKQHVFENHIQPGDYVLGLGSYGQTTYESEYNSGIGCNGLTSARHDVLSKYYSQHYPETYDQAIESAYVYSGNHKMTDSYISGDSAYVIGKLLLSPTRTFLPLLHQVFAAYKGAGIHGIIHNTGGAHSKVLKFSDQVKIIKDNLFPPPPIFQLIAQSSGASQEEMYKVFNMGTRLEIYGLKEELTRIAEIANTLNIPHRMIGKVIENKGKNSTVEMTVNHATWHYSL
jgi:phosphoribosylformylglycinamidine cyclo-ligase